MRREAKIWERPYFSPRRPEVASALPHDIGRDGRHPMRSEPRSWARPIEVALFDFVSAGAVESRFVLDRSQVNRRTSAKGYFRPSVPATSESAHAREVSATERLDASA